MPSNVVSEASLSTRISQWWSGIPSITGAIVIVCSSIYLVDLLVGYDSFQQVCFSPDTVIGQFQVFRLLTAVLFHASLLHVVFNMLALVPIGSSLERIMGSVRYLHVLMLLAISNAAVHLGIAYIVAYNPIYRHISVLSECQIGFSGILFGMIVIESSLYAGQTRSIFGLFNVPSKWYPWVLLIVFQLVMPNVSLLGHLSGIISGFAYVYGAFNLLLLSQSSYTKIESSWLCASCMRRPGFIVGGGAPNAALPSVTPSGNNGFSFGDTFQRLRTSLTPQAPAPAADQRFPGAARTLGGGAARAQPQQQNAAASNTDLEARLLDDDDDDLELVEAPPVSTGGTTAAANRPPRPPPSRPPARPASAPARAAPQPTSQGDKEANLRSLVAMGFEQNQASVALAASNGDITGAVEILSSQSR